MTAKNITYQQEALRKSTHFIALLIPIIFLLFSHFWAIIVMLSATIFIIWFEVVRLRKLLPWRFLKVIFGNMVRPKEEKDNFTGALYILFTALICILLFDKYIAAAAMSFIILGDVASAMVGRRIGKHKIRGSKSIEGSLAFLVVALIIAWFIPSLPFTLGCIGAVVATIVEAVSIYRDDNLTVPLSSGLVMYLLLEIFPSYFI